MKITEFKRLRRSFFRKLRWIYRLANDKSLICGYYPGKKTKSKLQIIIDNLLWLAKFQEHNEYYYAYGFDVKPRDEHWSYGGHIQHRDVRDRLNRRWVRGENTTSYCGLVADKFTCGIYLSSLGISTPPIAGLCNRNSIYWPETKERLPLESITARGDLDLFCKETLEGMGLGIFRLKVRSGQLFIDDKKSTIEELSRKLPGRHVLQERVQQHQSMDALCPSSVNTLRVVTIQRDGHPTHFASVLRLGVKGQSVDNWSAGGLAGSIDMETGQLGKYFLFKPGGEGRADRHPDTGVLFEEFNVPFAKEALNLCLEAHEHFYGIHSIGWDVAITPEGPTIIEANDEWGIQSLQVVYGGLLADFFKNNPKTF